MDVQPEHEYVVTIDDSGVTCEHPSRKLERVTWDAMDAVLIETNDSGPFGIDVRWLLVGREGRSGCVIPQGATGETELLRRLQLLPGFDNDQFIKAMGCIENRTFRCWSRQQPSMRHPIEYTSKERFWLKAIAIFGFLSVNGFFLYGLLFHPGSVAAALTNPVSAVVIFESLLLIGLLAYLLRRWGVSRLDWKWFVLLCLLGSMAFAVPVALLLPRRQTESSM